MKKILKKIDSNTQSSKSTYNTHWPNWPVLAWDLKYGRQWGRMGIKNMTHLHIWKCKISIRRIRVKIDQEDLHLQLTLLKLLFLMILKCNIWPPRWWLTISATFWLIRMMSMSSRRMKLLRVSWDGDIRMGGDTSSNPSAARLVSHLNVWDGSVLVHHHKVWPPVVYLILFVRL